MSRSRSGIESETKLLFRSSTPVLRKYMLSVLSRAGKFRLGTGSALPRPPNLCSDREWLTSRRSLRKNSGTRLAGMGIGRIAVPRQRNIPARLLCRLPGPAGTRRFPVGIAAGWLSPQKVRGTLVPLGSMRPVLTESGRFLLHMGFALQMQNQLRSIRGLHQYNPMPLKMADRFPGSIDSDVSNPGLKRSSLDRILHRMSVRSQAGNSLPHMESEIQRRGFRRSDRHWRLCNPADQN